MTPILTCDHEAELTCDRGTMRMLLMCALADANLWTRATGASQETKNHWARRSTIIRSLLEQLPPPSNPRDPYEDLPGEPTPEEADRIWRERAAQEDARSAARAGAQKAKAFGVDGDEWSTDLEIAAAAGMLEPPAEDDLLADNLLDPGRPGEFEDDVEDLLAL